MKLVFIAIVFLFIYLSYIFITHEDNSTQTNAVETREPVTKPKTELELLQDKFLQIDINSPELDLPKAIKEIKKARKFYPLDDKLKMIDIELEHKKANQSD